MTTVKLGEPHQPSAKRRRRLNKSGCRRMSPRQREHQLKLRMNPTRAEQDMIALLDAHPATRGKFEFQAHVCGYFPDFSAKSCRLILELDGVVHRGPRNQRADARRTMKLNCAGWQVIRFWNGELRRPDAVMDRIVASMALAAAGMMLPC